MTFPGAYANAASLVLGLGGILALTYGAAIAGSEWPWGTLKAAIARGESRSRYTLVGYLGVLVAVVIGFLAAYALALVGAAIGSAILGVPLDGAGQQSAILTLPELIGRGSLALSMEAAIGFAIATVARSQLAGIGVGIGLLVVQNIAGIFLPNVFKWFPFSAASRGDRRTSAGGGGGGGGGGAAGEPRPGRGGRRGGAVADRGARAGRPVDGTSRDRGLGLGPAAHAPAERRPGRPVARPQHGHDDDGGRDRADERHRQVLDGVVVGEREAG